MNHPFASPLSKTAPADQDLAEQARPGHGIPSQDPDNAAQMVGGTLRAVAGALSGAAAGTLVNPDDSSTTDTAPAQQRVP